MLALSLIAERENESVPITHSCIDKRPQVAHALPPLLCPVSPITHSCIDKRPQVTLISKGFSWTRQTLLQSSSTLASQLSYHRSSFINFEPHFVIPTSCPSRLDDPTVPCQPSPALATTEPFRVSRAQHSLLLNPCRP